MMRDFAEWCLRLLFRRSTWAYLIESLAVGMAVHYLWNVLAELQGIRDVLVKLVRLIENKD